MIKRKPITQFRAARILVSLDERMTKEIELCRKQGVNMNRTAIINKALHEYYRRRRTRKIA